MAFAVSGKVEGLEKLVRSLDSVAKKVKRKATRRAVSAAGKIVLKSAKQKARKATGLLRKSLGRKVKVYRGSGIAVAIVGPRAGFKQTVTRAGKEVLSNPVKYAHLVELGTKAHGYKTRGGTHPGSQAYPFLAPAFEDNKAQIQRAMASAIAEVLKEAAAP